jgi:hypothetical protein
MVEHKARSLLLLFFGLSFLLFTFTFCFLFTKKGTKIREKCKIKIRKIFEFQIHSTVKSILSTVLLLNYTLDEVTVFNRTLVKTQTHSLYHESVHLHRCPKYG